MIFFKFLLFLLELYLVKRIKTKDTVLWLVSFVISWNLYYLPAAERVMPLSANAESSAVAT